MRAITCYFSPQSGYAYLGHDRLCRIAEAHGAAILWRPVDIVKVFAESGIVPPAKQSPARAAYRRADMARWAEALNLPLNPAPRYWPVQTVAACKMIIAAGRLGGAVGTFIGAVHHAVWAGEENIADSGTLLRIAGECGFDTNALAAVAYMPEVAETAESHTAEAVAAGVFGSPSYVVGGELFWGQDRLDFVARRLTEMA